MRTSRSETEIKQVSLAPKFTCFLHVIKELVHAFSCAYIELWMHLGSLAAPRATLKPMIHGSTFVEQQMLRLLFNIC